MTVVSAAWLMSACGDEVAGGSGQPSAKADVVQDALMAGADAQDAAADANSADIGPLDSVGGDAGSADGAGLDIKVVDGLDDGGDGDGADSEDDASDAEDAPVILPDLPIWVDALADEQAPADSDAATLMDAGQEDLGALDGSGPELTMTDSAGLDVAALDTALPDVVPDALLVEDIADAAPDAEPSSDAQDAAGADQQDAKPFIPPPVSWEPVCFFCHGDLGTKTPAPPVDTNGFSDPKKPGVGAHASHIGVSNWHKTVACQECHKVPAKFLDPAVPTHLNSKTDLFWGKLAQQGAYDFAQLTCVGSYCHGNTLKPDIAGKKTVRAPAWTTLDGSQESCGQACHTTPPGGTHPADSACAKCHTAALSNFDPATQTAVWKDPTLHIDGKVDVEVNVTCTSCHGDPLTNNPAPPKGVKGQTATTDLAVGAHAKHLQASGWHRTGQCADCHTVPTQIPHADGTVDLNWGSVATTAGAQPMLDENQATCAGTWCHGAKLLGPKTGGKTLTKPVWTQVDGAQVACGSTCHTNPPGGNHPQSSNCSVCHGTVIASFDSAQQTASWVNPALHVNGKVDFANLTCTTCHGDPVSGSPAPPKGVNGETATTQAAVGAHAQHLGASTWHRGGECADCHIVPTDTAHTNDQLDLAWGAVPTAAGAKPSYTSGSLTCSGNYCHGATLLPAKVGGTTQRTPKWTVVDNSQDACGTACHTNPPGGSHPQSNACASCHGAVIASYDPASATAQWLAPALHVNGKVDVTALDCTSCHGDPASKNPAPPKGTQGQTATTAVAVGAHAQHLQSAQWHRDGQCTDCHTVPSNNLHTNGVVELKWGAIALADGATPSWDVGKAQCAGAYCHGGTLEPAKVGGKKMVTPQWTLVDNSQDACGTTCHTNPPGGTHAVVDNCQTCHGAVISAWDPATGQATWANGKLHADGMVQVGTATCTSCHGDVATNNPAPPLGTKGEKDTTAPAVGAHAQHLGSSSWHRGGECTDCHVVPVSTNHANAKLDLAFSGVAQSAGASTTFDAAKLTCSGSYCHGSTLAPAKLGGVTLHEPKWNQVDGSQDACGATCHTNPPGGTHPKSTACASCHGAVIASWDAGTAKATWANPALHIDGKVETAQLQCTSCHGDPITDNPAPPKGTLGQTQTTQKAVGAHQQHLAASGWHKQGACADCHTVPTSTLHTDSVVDVTWGAAAKSAGANPAWDGQTTTCTGSYCHGNTLGPAKSGGVTLRSPTWTQVDGTQDACGSTCHTNPPGGSHPQGQACASCHDAVIASYDAASGKAVWANANLHIDGKVEVKSLDCTSCHGDAVTKNPAPPLSTQGETATAAPGVGAHAQHLSSSPWHRTGQCGDCHATPASVLHTNGKLDFAWGAVPLAGGAQPSFDASILTCTGSYCHGATLAGPKPGAKVAREPQWNQVDGSWDSCGATCHTNPPGGNHPKSNLCANCHGAVISGYNSAANTATWKDPTLHVNGKVDVVTLNCTTCHGDAVSNNPAPPKGTLGEIATTTQAVGAHAQHGGTSTWHRDVQCSDCHQMPATVNHSDGAVDLSWGVVPLANSATPVWDVKTTTCSGVYCHGTTLLGPKAGGTVMRTPKWTQVDGSQDACGVTCHTLPPGGTHPQNTACATCHTTVIASNDPANTPVKWADRTLHIDGKIDVGTLTCTSCHGDKPSNNPAPPISTKGETATSAIAVGAHKQHLGPSTSHRAGQCSDCHVVPVSLSHGNGIAEVTWGSLAKAAAQSPVWDNKTAKCSNNYCHGSSQGPAKAGGAVMRTPQWTQVDGSQGKCGATCHTNPPGGSHPQSTACASCHGAVIAGYDAVATTATWKDPGLHVNGEVEVAQLTCTTCHGDPVSNNPAPPKGTKGETQTSAKAVGAHASHLGASGWHRAGSCEDCHMIPSSVLHTNGVTELSFGPVSSAADATPSWDAGALTCSGGWCHGAKLPAAKQGGTVMRTPKWTQVDGSQAACGTTCHTNPPGDTHPKSTACGMCHASVVSSFDPVTQATVWANADLHVNGKVDVIGMSCTSCHGDPVADNPAPPKGTQGETQTTQVAVGAHAQHLAPSGWHAGVQCTDCHQVPVSMTHTDGKVDLAFSGVAVAAQAQPVWDKANVTCSGSYCHGATLLPAATGGTVNHTPLWTKVDGSQDACGATCHTNPPGGTHPASTNCAQCHSMVLSAYVPGSPPTATWVDPTLHINGKVDVKPMTCTSCHGDAVAKNPAPPLGTKGEKLTSDAAVGAHTQHLGASTWHREGQCTDCHAVPVDFGHSNGVLDLNWGGPAAVGGATPAFVSGNLTCTGTYCHGNTLWGPKAGGTVARTPVWNIVNGSWDACGKTCHTLPPAAPHPQNENCAQCHDAVMKSIVMGDPPTVVWNNPALHIDGKIDVPNVSCTSCHGNKATSNPMPPLGSKGETATTQAAVGAHAAHVGTATWHRDGQCTDCHAVPISTLHSNGKTDFAWSAPSNAGNLTPSYAASDAKCANNWCHGSGLGAAKAGGAVMRTPQWTLVDGSQDACGTTCHTNPPGDKHAAHTDCSICHTAVVAAFNPSTSATTWADRTLHVNGTIESNKYHNLSGWTSPKFGANHHGSNYFVRNQQRDEHNVPCTQCHGADLLGGTVGVSCANNSCHGGDWKSCDFCHGTKGGSGAPPIGVANESATNTLGVGRHTAHLNASATHTAIACTVCHSVPPTGDIAHALQYVYSADLTTAGHHGDLAFSAGAVGMTFNVATTTGNPITGRGTCLGACHSNGRGGAPVVTPYWAGGSWTVGSCGTCHAASPSSYRHNTHVAGEGMACVNCHPAASSSSHLNGKRDTLTTIVPSTGTGSVTSSPGTGTCATVRCNGTCHNQNHSNYCWSN